MLHIARNNEVQSFRKATTLNTDVKQEHRQLNKQEEMNKTIGIGGINL
jgi:hypothetical protein